MRFLVTLAALLLSAATAEAAEPRPLDLGMAQIGMRLNQLRFAAFPANTKLVCGNDEPKPPGAERVPLAVVSAMAAAKVDRCAIFSEDSKGQWALRPAVVAGKPVEFWFMSIEDEAGTQRIFQIVGLQPREYFDLTAEYLVGRWGAPVQKIPHFVRWLNGTSEGQLSDDNEGAHLFLFDTKLHQLLESRAPKGKPKKDAKPPAGH